jgi:hypothetical protein
MELDDGDFDDSAFPAFLAGYPVDAVTSYPEDPGTPVVCTGAATADSSTCTELEISMMKSKLQRLGALSLVGAAGVANAATDTTAITAAGTDIAAVLAVIFGVLVAVWAAKMIQRKTVGG